jgi:hypothetical protein
VAGSALPHALVDERFPDRRGRCALGFGFDVHFDIVLRLDVSLSD